MAWEDIVTQTKYGNGNSNKEARKLAKFMVKIEFSNFSEHIKNGERNNVADTLSRDFSRSKNDLTNHISHLFPKHVSQNFIITSVPQGLISWILSFLEDSIMKEESYSKPHRKRKLTSGNGLISVQE